MTRGLSLYLDAVRFGAAFLVLLSHWAYPRFTGGSYLWIREFNLGSDAVVVFFVLSGLVIAFAAEKKDKSAGTFVFNRATRLYSVVLPALFLTLVLDRTGALLWPDAYAGWWYNPLPVPVYLLSGLSFSNEWGLLGMRLGTNGPFWSLSYEVAYYALFAAAVYLRGAARILVIVCLVLLIGFRPLMLLPAWLLGVAVWKTIAAPGFRMNAGLAWSFALLPVGLYVFSLATDVPASLLASTADMTSLSETQVRALFRFSDEFLWNTLLAALVAVNFVGVAALGRTGSVPDMPDGLRRFLVWGAGGSFSLYLVHYPLLQFVGPALKTYDHLPGRDFLLLLLVFALSMGFAGLFERRLRTVRQGATAVLARLESLRHRLSVRQTPSEGR